MDFASVREAKPSVLRIACGLVQLSGSKNVELIPTFLNNAVTEKSINSIDLNRMRGDMKYVNNYTTNQVYIYKQEKSSENDARIFELI